MRGADHLGHLHPRQRYHGHQVTEPVVCAETLVWGVDGDSGQLRRLRALHQLRVTRLYQLVRVVAVTTVAGRFPPPPGRLRRRGWHAADGPRVQVALCADDDRGRGRRAPLVVHLTQIPQPPAEPHRAGEVPRLIHLKIDLVADLTGAETKPAACERDFPQRVAEHRPPGAVGDVGADVGELAED